ncbi:MAG: DUF1800 family protein [Povalibacter sp.]
MNAFIATNRFGLGARPKEIAEVGSDGKAWLLQQIERKQTMPASIEALPSSAEVLKSYQELVKDVRAIKKATRKNSPSDKESLSAFGNARRELAPLYLDQVAARYRVAIESTNTFRERLVHFWTNHFAVSVDKVAVLGLAGTLENEAIRPHIDGTFADMLLAVESHPAMILYLDNQRSVGPNSSHAHRAARRLQADKPKLDINENLAREILELHTLGVDGGYTQKDVTSFARVLTGWSLGGARGVLAEGTPGTFEFRENMHEPGAQIVLGKRYAEDGMQQPRAVLLDLARQPATARHIATKLVRHFIADEPPADAVAHITDVFRDSAGHLPSIHAALIHLPAAWSESPSKFKTPHEFVVSAFRSLDFLPELPMQIAGPFQLLGQRPYAPGSPAGWPDTAAQWDGPDALMKRIEWATQMGDRMQSRVHPLEVAHSSLGDALSERTQQSIARASSAAQGLTLLFASPDFMRR